MTFKEHQDKLSDKKYNPIDNKVVNQLVINNQELDRVANSCQRLIIKAMSKSFHFKSTPDSTLFEIVQIGNLAIAEAINYYQEEKIDFAYFCYVQILNSIKTNFRSTGIVRPSIVNKVRQYPTYLHIDAPLEDYNDGFDIPQPKEEEVFKLDTDFIFELIQKRHKLFRKKYMDIYVMRKGLNGNDPSKYKEIEKEFGMTKERAQQIVRDVEIKMKENKKILNYLSQFCDF